MEPENWDLRCYNSDSYFHPGDGQGHRTLPIIPGAPLLAAGNTPTPLLQSLGPVRVHQRWVTEVTLKSHPFGSGPLGLMIPWSALLSSAHMWTKWCAVWTEPLITILLSPICLQTLRTQELSKKRALVNPTVRFTTEEQWMV